MKPSIIATLKQLSEDGNAVFFSSPASDGDIKLSSQQAMRELGAELDESYITLIKVCNGIQINNAVIEGIESLIDSNVELRTDDPAYLNYVVFGHQGNMDLYVYNYQNRKFEMVNFFHPEDAFETFDSFDELMFGILKNQQL